MLRFALAALLASAAFAQTPTADGPKPPADVDAALRARITEFYQYHVTGEYRKAEKLVAEESQDIYYEAGKRKYVSFEIKSIAYLDDFTKAKVTVTCEQYVSGLGSLGRPVKMPSTSTWKVVDGKWMWYVSPEELSQGAMGKSANAGTKPAPGKQQEAPVIPTTPDFALGKIKLEKDALTFQPNETYTIGLANGSQGTSAIVLHQILPGWQVSIDKANVNPGEKAVITLKTGDNPHSGLIQFEVTPSGEILSIVAKRQLAGVK